jgi:predicted metal-binding membrane protein
MAMAGVMAAMMLPTAAPFFFAYGRDTRRPSGVVITVLVYVAVWGAIGAVADFVVNQAMVPSSARVTALAIAFAVLYTLSPWSRRARARCRELCMRAPRGAGPGGALVEGSTYAACCVVCSAGVMVALVVLGMSNPLFIAAAAGVLMVDKVTDWGPLRAVMP